MGTGIYISMEIPLKVYALIELDSQQSNFGCAVHSSMEQSRSLRQEVAMNFLVLCIGLLQALA